MDKKWIPVWISGFAAMFGASAIGVVAFRNHKEIIVQEKHKVEHAVYNTEHWNFENVRETKDGYEYRGARIHYKDKVVFEDVKGISVSETIKSWSLMYGSAVACIDLVKAIAKAVNAGKYFELRNEKTFKNDQHRKHQIFYYQSLGARTTDTSTDVLGASMDAIKRCLVKDWKDNYYEH